MERRAHEPDAGTGRQVEAMAKDQSAPIVLYCRSGRRSEIAALDLAERGFTNVSHLSGGMVDWRKTGHQVFEK